MNARNLSLIGLILAVVMAIGVFLPWASALGLISVSGVSGDGGDGWFILIAAVIGLVGALWGLSAGRLRVGPGVLLLIGGAIGTFVAIVDVLDVSGEPMIDLGIGLILCLIGSILMALLGIVGLITKPAAQ